MDWLDAVKIFELGNDVTVIELDPAKTARVEEVLEATLLTWRHPSTRQCLGRIATRRGHLDPSCVRPSAA